MSDTTSKVLEDISSARVKAEEKHGKNYHYYPIWISLMTEELGEAAKEAHTLHWGGYVVEDLQALRAELIDLAQLSVAVIEQIDRDIKNIQNLES